MAEILGTDILGTIGDDILNGTNGDDTITTFEGNDTVDAGAGDDLIIGDENGTGVINGGDGFDTFQFTSDDDLVNFIASGSGVQQIVFDTYVLNEIERAERLNQNGEIEDLIQLGSSGNDIIDLTTLTLSNSSRYILSGGDGNDSLTAANNGTGTLLGGNGADTLIGLGGNDTLNGGLGNDTLIGGQGADSLRGGTGNNIFQIDALSEANGDMILDFDSGDSIVFTAAATFVGASAFSASGGAEIRAIESGGTTLVQYDADGNGTTDGTLTIANGEFELSDINAGGAVTLAVDDTITGTSGNDTLTGTVNDDVINGLGGDDIITTLTGNDIVDAGAGDDLIIIDINSLGSFDGGVGFDTLQIASTSFSTFTQGITGSNSCLLYTSPSPRDATLSRMPSSA